MDILQLQLNKDYEYIIQKGKYIYYSEEYIYDFSFNATINSSTIMPLSINVLKNENTNINIDCQLQQDNNGIYYYRIIDNEVLRYGSYTYKVQMVLSGGKIVVSSFTIKVLNVDKLNINNEIKLVAFSTYGLHEQYNYLKLLAQVESNRKVDRIELYSNSDMHTAVEKWKYLGDMQQNNDDVNIQYSYQDLLITETYLTYKIKVFLHNGYNKEYVINVDIDKNSFSLNHINYGDTTKNTYDVYGGIVFKINNDNSYYHDKICQFIVDTRIRTLQFILDEYKFVAYNFNIKYPSVYRDNETNEAPNIFYINGEGLINVNNTKVEAKCNIRLICGEDTFIYFDILSNREEYSLSSTKTINNVVLYNNSVLDLEQLAYKNQLASMEKVNGFFTYLEGKEITAYTPEGVVIRNLDITDNVYKYFVEANCILYNAKNIFFVTYNTDGIRIVKFDGINIQERFYYITIYDLDNAQHNIRVILDVDENINLRFYNGNNQNVLDKIIINNGAMSIQNYNETIKNIYNEVYQNAKQYVNNIETIEEYDSRYIINVIDTVDIIESGFNSMHWDSFNNDSSMQEFYYKLQVKVQINRIRNGKISVPFKADMYINTRASVNIFNDDYDIEVQQYDIEIVSNSWSFEQYSNINNQMPRNIMEDINDSYFIRAHEAVKSKNKDDYGVYKKCSLYKKSSLYYNITVRDVYGDDCTITTIRYEDIVRMRFIELNTIGYLINYYNNNQIINIINLVTKTRIKQYIINSKMFYYKYYDYTEAQLENVNKLFTYIYESDGTDRKIKVHTISDWEQLYVSGLGEQIQPMNSIINISNNQINSFYLENDISWPLNIKNQQTMLNNLYFHTEI